MTVELSVLPWPAAIASADGELREYNALWKERFSSCDELETDFPEAANKLRTVVAQQEGAGALFQVRAPGEIAPLRLRFAAIRDADAESLWLMIAQDREDEEPLPVTPTDTRELRDVELAMDGVAMRLQARNWRAFFHEAAAGKALIGLQGETLEVNRALCQLIGRPEHQLLDTYVRDIRHPDDADAVGEHYRSILNGGPPVAGIEARYRHQAGHYLTCLLALSLIRDSRGKPLYFAAEIEDITSRRQAEVRLRQGRQQLERANLELLRSNLDLERFAFVASHDLQEPLRKIRVFGDRLQTLATNSSFAAETVEADVVRYVNVMTGAAERMQNLVDDLLTYGRLKNQDTSLVAVDLNEVWADLREEFETTLRESGGQLQVGVLPIVRGNEFRLRQLFGNLLSNSLKFRGDEPPRIEVRALIAGATGGVPATVAIEIEDNGVGFEQVYAETIFEIFARLHGRSQYSGTGIGLAICRRVAHEHGGDLRAFSAPGQGARFVVTLAM